MLGIVHWFDDWLLLTSGGSAHIKSTVHGKVIFSILFEKGYDEPVEMYFWPKSECEEEQEETTADDQEETLPVCTCIEYLLRTVLAHKLVIGKNHDKKNCF